MRSELACRRQMLAIRRILQRKRKRKPLDGEADAMLYGAQQALFWMLGTGMSPIDLDGLIEDLAAETGDDDGPICDHGNAAQSDASYKL